MNDQRSDTLARAMSRASGWYSPEEARELAAYANRARPLIKAVVRWADPSNATGYLSEADLELLDAFRDFNTPDFDETHPEHPLFVASPEGGTDR